MVRFPAVIFVALLAVGHALADAVPPKSNVEHFHHDGPPRHWEEPHHPELKTVRVNFYEPENAFVGAFGAGTGDAGTTGGYSGLLACAKDGVAIAACHQAGIFTTQTSVESYQQNLQMLGCEIKANSCGLGVGQIHGIGLTYNGNWADVPGVGSIYPVHFSVIGGTGAYANVVGGTVTFTGNGFGTNGPVTTFDLRVAL